MRFSSVILTEEIIIILHLSKPSVMTITFHFVRNLFFYLLNDFYITLNNKMTPDVIDIIIENKSLFVNILQFEDFENQEKHSTPFATST